MIEPPCNLYVSLLGDRVFFMYKTEKFSNFRLVCRHRRTFSPLRPGSRETVAYASAK